MTPPGKPSREQFRFESVPFLGKPAELRSGARSFRVYAHWVDAGDFQSLFGFIVLGLGAIAVCLVGGTIGAYTIWPSSPWYIRIVIASSALVLLAKAVTVSRLAIQRWQNGRECHVFVIGTNDCTHWHFRGTAILHSCSQPIASCRADVIPVEAAQVWPQQPWNGYMIQLRPACGFGVPISVVADRTHAVALAQRDGLPFMESAEIVRVRASQSLSGRAKTREYFTSTGTVIGDHFARRLRARLSSILQSDQVDSLA